MMDRDLEKCYEILELAPGASLTEVKNAYLRLKKLFSEDSPLLTVMTAEFPAEKRSAVLEEIENAYARIQAAYTPPPESRPPAPPWAQADPESTSPGRNLKKRRESRGISLQDLYQATKIRVEILENIESEKFEALPDESFLRTHLAQLARHLGLEPKEVIEPYLERYAEWRKRWAHFLETERKK